MKANNILKTLFTKSVEEYILGAHYCKSTVQRVILVEKILDLIVWEGRVREGGSKANKVLQDFW